jgi:hypothetical protein
MNCSTVSDTAINGCGVIVRKENKIFRRFTIGLLGAFLLTATVDVCAATVQLFQDASGLIIGYTPLTGAEVNAVVLDSSATRRYWGGKFDTLDLYKWNGSVYAYQGTATSVNNLFWDTASGQITLFGPNQSSNGVDGKVNSIAVTSTYVYVAGLFNNGKAGSTTYSPNCIRWNIAGNAWNALYSSMYGGLNNEVYVVKVMGASDAYPGDLYVGGRFTDVSGYTTADYLAKWHDPNPSWIPVASNISAPVISISFQASYPYYSYTTQ